MRFLSLNFTTFLCILLPVYWLIRKKGYQNLILLTASYIFYGWVHPWYAILLGSSTVVDYFIGIAIDRFYNKKRVWLAISLLTNLGALGYFKYSNFFAANIISTLNAMGLEADPIILQIILPAGISFYTLKKLSYILDVYRETTKPVVNFVEYALLISFFPQLIAGPIDRPGKLLPQIQKPRKWSRTFFNSAWPLLVMGLFKKIVVADTIGVVVDKIYALQEPTKFLLVVGTLGFSLQIFADFSGYTDLSRGIAYLFGFETSENFKSPYISLSPTDFWNRWHITLTDWLRDYIFFPLRRYLLKRFRNKSPSIALMLPPLITMLVSGFWHGAGWTYIAWGLFYGFVIIIYQQLGAGVKWRSDRPVITTLAWSIMFSVIVFGWMLFKAPSLGWLTNILIYAPFIGTQAHLTASLVSLSMIAFYSAPLVIKFMLDKSRKNNSALLGAYYALATVLTIIYVNSSSPDFIYFQF